jgi:5-methylcytosine-specific restriction endonuclease McrA
MNLQRLTLVLNASYEPINIVTARRAIKLVMKGAAYVELASPHLIRTVLGGIPVPSIVRLLVYRKMPRLNRSVSRKSIMLRDRHTCQYCNRSLAPKLLTLDHVVPRSKGGAGRGKTSSPPVTCATTGRPTGRPQKRACRSFGSRHLLEFTRNTD